MKIGLVRARVCARVRVCARASVLDKDFDIALCAYFKKRYASLLCPLNVGFKNAPHQLPLTPTPTPAHTHTLHFAQKRATEL